MIPADPRFTRRALLVGAGMGAVGVTLAGRMAYLSVWEGAKYSAQAEGNRVSLRLIPPRRGWIVDRSGKPLALNAPDYRLELLPDQVKDLDATLAAVGKVLPLSPDDLDRIRADLARQPKFMPVEIAHGLDWPAFARVNVDLPDLPGVAPVPGYARVYPGGDHFAHLLGYVGTPTADQYAKLHDPLLIFPGFKLGKDGIERRADASLRGVAGARRVEVTARGRVIRDLDTRPDVPGRTLRLTIDRDLQSYAARRLTDNSASVVVMDVHTGDVLCMVSMPAYDPNVFSTRVTAKLWAELQADDHHPLINKSAQGLYPPGSTFKTMTALAILTAGIPAEQATGCTGTYRLGNAAWHCWSKRGHGRVDLHKAIPQSCDVYFYTFGRAVGVDAIAATARKFGLGAKFDLPLPGQSAGIIPDTAWKEARYKKAWGIGDTINTSIGQGYIVANPLQLAVMAARLASGTAVEPRLYADAPRTPAPPLDVAPGPPRRRPQGDARRRQQRRGIGQDRAADGRRRPDGGQDGIGAGPRHLAGRSPFGADEHQVPAVQVPRPRAVRRLRPRRRAALRGQRRARARRARRGRRPDRARRDDVPVRTRPRDGDAGPDGGGGVAQEGCRARRGRGGGEGRGGGAGRHGCGGGDTGSRSCAARQRRRVMPC